jgi:hypothetical protein
MEPAQRGTRNQATDKSRLGLTTKIVALVDALVPRHSDFDLLNPRSHSLWQEFRINEQFDATGDPGLPSDEACAFERDEHLVNGRRGDLKILPDVGFGRRPV